MDSLHQSPLKNEVFTRRAFCVAGLQVCGIFALGGRLAWLQTVQGGKYQKLSENNRINAKLLAPPRGKIFDRYGEELASNTRNFRLLIVPEQVKNLEESLYGLSKIIELDKHDFDRTLRRAKSSAKFFPIEVKDFLTWREVSKIEVNIPSLPGVLIDSGDVRFYPHGKSTGHITGYVGMPKEEEITRDNLLKLPGFRVGKTGLERGQDSALRGIAGSAEVEVNVVGREVRELKRKDSIPGMNLTTSLDMGLQEFLYERLSTERSASAVVMDAHTGAVYAMASYPSYDPNDFARSLSSQTWKGLLEDPAIPLTNKAIAGQYPPASTFKMITAIAGMRTGHVTRDRRSYCSGHFEFGNQRFHCWKLTGHGSVDLVDALAFSCDTYFYHLAMEIGIDEIAKTAREFGLGQKYDFDLPEEKSGLIPDKKWKYASYGKSWSPGETINATIGQGYLLATPLQLAVMTARLVNGGYAVKPWINGYIGKTPVFRNAWPKIDIPSEYLEHVKEGMIKVVNDKTGTGYASRITEADMAMGGKTGTAQVKKINRAERARGIMNEDLMWKHRHHALFVGYAPHDNPRYVCSVIVEHGIGGAVAAAPIARDILREVQIRHPAGYVLNPISEHKVR